MTKVANSNAQVTTFDAVIVGAGFSGLYVLHRLRSLGFTARVFEAGSGVGGTWFWNRYPGARCDVESMEYSFSFSPELEQEWKWSERYSAQPEILKYLNHVADRFDLRRDIALDTRVDRADFDERDSHWQVATQHGDTYRARFCIMATGCLSAPRAPDFEGLGSFAGPIYHTGAWPHGPVDFTGQRVGVIGTGSSGIQSIPVIAEQAARLFVFQRTPNFSVPALNGPLSVEHEQRIKSTYRQVREQARESAGGITVRYGNRSALSVSEDERWQEYEARWREGSFSLLYAFSDLITNGKANDTAAEYVRSKIRAIVKDPQTAELLSPTDHPLGTKRICVDTGYFETFNRPTVQLVNVKKNPIERITSRGVLVAGHEYEIDTLVLATGFDAMTGALLKIDIRGRDGLMLREKWEAGPRTYLGLSVAQFPNLFTVTGPGSPSVLTNMVTSIEHHVGWITDCMVHMRAKGLTTVEAQEAAEGAWVEHVNEVAAHTLYPQANSWYMGANVPGKPRVFMPYVGGLNVYIQKCDEVVAHGYVGFSFSSGQQQFKPARRARARKSG